MSHLSIRVEVSFSRCIVSHLLMHYFSRVSYRSLWPVGKIDPEIEHVKYQPMLCPYLVQY